MSVYNNLGWFEFDEMQGGGWDVSFLYAKIMLGVNEMKVS